MSDNPKPRAIRSDNKTGCIGVYYNKWTYKYHAEIRLNGMLKRLGMFENLEDAIAARKAAELERDGLDLL